MAEKDTGLERNPPQSPDIERAVLSAMLFDEEAIGLAIEMIDENAFFRPANSVMYRAMTDLYDQRIPVDQFTLTERLKQSGHLEFVGGENTIAGLAADPVSAVNIKYHCQILKDKALLRKIIIATTSIRNRCFEDGADTARILDALDESIISLANMRDSKEYVPLSSQIDLAFKEIETRANAEEGVTGVDTGFHRLNKLTSGWQPSDLIILAGRPSMGKTAFALDLAKNAARQGVPVGVFSLEMSTMQLVMRMLFNEARFDGSSLREKKPKSQDWTRLTDACARMGSYPIYIDDTPGLSTVELFAKAKRMKADKHVGLLVIDYLQLMQGTSRESRQQEISSISRSLKTLAKELDVPVIALSQLSRALESRNDHRPMLSDLRESGAIEQDADVVMFIYRASVYGDSQDYAINDEHVPVENVAEVIVRKQRNGPIGAILLHWIKEYTRFAEFSYESSGEYF